MAKGKIKNIFGRDDAEEKILPEQAAAEAGILPDEKLPHILSDMNDSFEYADVYIAYKDNVIYKYTDSLERFGVDENDELFVDISATSLSLIIKKSGSGELVRTGMSADLRSLS